MKKLTVFLLCFLILTTVVAGASASEYDLPPIIDNAGVLTPDQITGLSETAYDIRKTYEMDVVILVVTDLDGKSSQDYADDYYDYNGYGVGSDYSGVLLLIATESRDWWISTCGDAIYALTDYGIESIFASFSGYLAQNDYNRAFEVYLSCLPTYFEAFRQGEPIDGFHGDYSGPGSYSPGDADDIIYYEDHNINILRILAPLLVGLIASFITVAIMSSKMNTKRPQNSAINYLDVKTYRLLDHSDVFLYSNVTKSRRQESSSSSSGGGNSSRSSGGGSSVHTSSSGRSHGGGGGKF